MRRQTKHYIVLSLIVFFGLSIALKILAKGLNVSYPSIQGVVKPNSPYVYLTIYLKYLYSFAIAISGIILFVVLIRGGISYFLSAGNPGKLKNSREKIKRGILGLIIVFSSYLILNTINPQLVVFPVFNFPTSTPATPPNPQSAYKKPTITFEEIPFGTLITSEFSLSSFYTSSAPKVCAVATNHTTACKYATDFQGALYGERLKRIHEVAGTTLPMADMSYILSGDLYNITKNLTNALSRLKNYALECSCNHCHCSGCLKPCGGQTCPHKNEMEILRKKIPDIFYKDDDDLIPCKIYEIQFFSGAFQAFLDSYNMHGDYYQNLVDRPTSTDDYMGSPKAQRLIGKIQKCVKKGTLDAKQWETIKNKLVPLMAKVENKGTYTLKTKPPERDVETNLFHLLMLIDKMQEVKERLNPYSQLPGCLSYVPRAAVSTFEAATQYKVKIQRDTFGNVFGQGGKPIRVIEDPATFYIIKLPSPKTSPWPVLPLKNNNIVYAQSPPISHSYCARTVEIPVGTVLDKATKLSSQIWSELFNIYYKGHFIINSLAKQIKIAKQMTKLSDKLIKLTSDDHCQNSCYLAHCRSECDAQKHCFCPQRYTCDDTDKIISTMKAVEKSLEEIKAIKKQIFLARKSMYKSFCKLSSAIDPETGKPCYIGSDFCCNRGDTNCRDKKGNLNIANIKERKYTVKEKLVEVQKLLNRSREVMNLDKDKHNGESAYEILLDQLIKLGLAKKAELNILSQDKFDLGNCQLRYVQLQEAQELGEAGTDLLNCKVARGEVADNLFEAINSENQKICDPDPLLDCDYFNPATKRYWKREGANLNCYCYDPRVAGKGYQKQWFPQVLNSSAGSFSDVARNASSLGTPSYLAPAQNFASNLFCCVKPYEK